MQLDTNNAFGMISVKSGQISVTVTATAENQNITRTVVNELPQPLSGFPADGKEVNILFAALLASKDRTKITMHELPGSTMDHPAADFPEVGKTLADALKQVKAAAHID